MILLLLWTALAQSPDERGVLAEIQAYDTQILSLSSQMEELDKRAATATAQQQADESAARTAETELNTRRTQTARLVAATYRLERHGFLRLLFGAESPWELRRRAHYLEAVVRTSEARRRQFADASKERADRMARAGASREALQSLRDELQTSKAALEAERNKRVNLLRQIRGTPQLAARAVVEVQQARSELSRSMANREATIPSAEVAGDTNSFRSQKGRLPRPVNGAIARAFGAYVDPASGQRTNNLGVDFAAEFGTPFRAVAAGTVTRAAYVQGYGQMVVVQHGSFTTLYAHANGLRVAAGQTVNQGDVLGLVGNTGLAEDVGCRLHFEVRYNNTPQDPAEWLGR